MNNSKLQLAISNAMKKKLSVILELALTLFIIAYLRFHFGRVILGPVGISIFVILIKIGKLLPKEIGLRTDNLRKTLPIYLVLYSITILGALLIKVGGISFIDKRPVVGYRFMGLVFLSAVAQETYYRGYLPIRLKIFTQDKFKLTLIISFVFTLVHILLMPIIGYNLNLVLFSCFISLLWTSIYLRHPNLYLRYCAKTLYPLQGPNLTDTESSKNGWA